MGNVNLPMKLLTYLAMVIQYVGNLWELSQGEKITHNLHM